MYALAAWFSIFYEEVGLTSSLSQAKGKGVHFPAVFLFSQKGKGSETHGCHVRN